MTANSGGEWSAGDPSTPLITGSHGGCGKTTISFLSRTEVANHIGVAPSTLSRYNLPEPDVTIGKTRGWRVSTIDQWNEQRPGSGRWGRRGATSQGGQS